jgi:hypothetical protein
LQQLLKLAAIFGIVALPAKRHGMPWLGHSRFAESREVRYRGQLGARIDALKAKLARAFDE